MNKKQNINESTKKFNEALSEALKYMKPEDIEKAMEELGECREQVFEHNARCNREVAWLLADTEKKEHTFHYERFRKKGELKVLGVNLPDYYEVKNWKHLFPRGERFNWWALQQGNVLPLMYNNINAADVHPLLVTEDLEAAGIKIGEHFYINAMDFVAVSSNSAVLVRAIGTCNNNTGTQSLNSSMPKFCIDGWYTQLIKDNEELSRMEAEGCFKNHSK